MPYGEPMPSWDTAVSTVKGLEKPSRRWSGFWMFYRKKRESGLSKLVEAVSRVKGVVAAVFFGSRARGDFEEYSDYDLLVVFEDEESRTRNSDKLYEEVSKTGLFAQVLAFDLNELGKIDPTFLNEVRTHGRLVYLRHPVESPLVTAGLRAMRIVTYDLKKLTHKEKQRFGYKLFGKKTERYSYEGELERLGGKRLGDGCIMVPEEGYARIAEILTEFGVEHRTVNAHVLEGGR